MVRALGRLSRGYSDDPGPLSALVLLVVGAVTIWVGLSGLWIVRTWEAPAWWHLVPLLVGCAANLVRRSHPGITLAVAVPVFMADLLIGGSLAVLLVLFDAIYSAERFGSQRLRQVVRFGAGVVTVGVTIASALAGMPPRAVAAMALQTVAMLAVPIWWALDVRHRTELADAATARAELEVSRAAERARAQDAERRSAVQAERSRMARELHDAVAGDVSALVIRAGAALAAPPGPSDRESLAAVRESGLHALGELRTMIEVLAADGTAEPIAPTLTQDGAELLERAEAQADGVAPADLAPLTPAVDRAGYRVLQEALTNAARHGRPGTTRVHIQRDGDRVEMRVRNAVERGSEPATGIGLASMTERAHAVGGMLEVGIEEDTWTVAATLPATS
ncbi:sensor histidine kinase [Pseudactinotalea suaedae]|uniref:sensor histidine kinase n=1 Tax=Pseudactinotalea suaedae TaxID=1524924 RepID=UPI001F4F83F0|nr:histidine kinase [Pseudactinotalea suaedae]